MKSTVINWLFPQVRFIVEVNNYTYLRGKGQGTCHTIKESWKYTLPQLRANPATCRVVSKGRGNGQVFLDGDSPGDKERAVWFSYDRRHNKHTYRRLRWLRQWQAKYGIAFRFKQ